MKHPLISSAEIKRNMCHKEDFTEQSKALTKETLKTFTIERAHLQNQKNQAASSKIPLILTYTRTLADLKRAVNKH